MFLLYKGTNRVKKHNKKQWDDEREEMEAKINELGKNNEYTNRFDALSKQIIEKDNDVNELGEYQGDTHRRTR
ncbi:Oidioi.mRNA.OKI2018_I69.YSR.g17065.t1.cds [Oikopleura dioica]|uniref:Oidioi.mRNA.OKI2018_I69.YSR.g17065.t1.cds n=1 Tax=Oikopleura dioica TaxID=34765 RepID=A0ABN7SI25_OIKDI|nr:Oidioi.mRNA.OKI2018_I69.YSR.g17065.t1.cds [Oikopleura dioica]